MCGILLLFWMYKMNKIKKKLTPAEIKLFEEHVIHEYKTKHEKIHAFDDFTRQMMRFIPVNIVIGILACIGIVILKDWETLLYIFLWSIIWITLISTVLTALFKRR